MEFHNLLTQVLLFNSKRKQSLLASALNISFEEEEEKSGESAWIFVIHTKSLKPPQYLSISSVSKYILLT